MCLLTPAEFIENFKENNDEQFLTKLFSEENSWYFTVILKDRFFYLKPEVYYNPTTKQFASEILGKFYDITGEVIGRYIPWFTYKRENELEANRITTKILKIKNEKEN